ncbi:MAG: type III pantothenate kinase [Lachnospiraceae bacterium]|nr:type III pantothenate kinase [Lachnospiraceae bacterium]
MILAIDTGNTHIVMGCISESGEISEIIRMETNQSKTAHEYAADMLQIFSLVGVDPGRIQGAVISSVVPPVTITLRNAVRMITGLDALILGAGVKTGLDIAIDDPGTIAPDFVANAVAAKEYYKHPCIIVDLGTATTVTVVDARGRYIGGAIMPGVDISMSALTSETSLLPNIEIEVPAKTIASNTIDSMKSGIIYGSAGALDGVIDRFKEVLGGQATVVATGSLAQTICPHCRHEITIEEDLMMKGLFLIWKKNQIRRRK